jgi:hypothetical protein
MQLNQPNTEESDQNLNRSGVLSHAQASSYFFGQIPTLIINLFRCALRFLIRSPTYRRQVMTESLERSRVTDARQHWLLAYFR